jgi:lysophospholipase L1-like esterase
MFRKQYKDIKITPESKIVIGLGDSFTQGKGASSIENWEKFNWDLKSYEKDSNTIFEDYENSWVNQLCKHHLTDYIPVNFGLSGCGNRATVKQLYLHPELNLEMAKEKIVIFLLSGMERFDFVNRQFNDHHNFFAMWPNPWDKTSTNYELWKIYSEDIWDDKFGYIEMLLNIVEAQMWAKANNAKFVLGSAFRNDYQRKNFQKMFSDENTKKLVDVINWDNYVYPGGYPSFTDLLVHLEDRDDLLGGGFYAWSFEQEKMSPKQYFTKCGHPSFKGHKVIADELYKFIKYKKMT